jgi:hypothetical protein
MRCHNCYGVKIERSVNGEVKPRVYCAPVCQCLVSFQVEQNAVPWEDAGVKSRESENKLNNSLAPAEAIRPCRKVSASLVSQTMSQIAPAGLCHRKRNVKSPRRTCLTSRSGLQIVRRADALGIWCRNQSWL